MFLRFGVVSVYLGRNMFLRGNSAMLPLLLMVLLMFRRDEIYVRFILLLALVSLAVADEIWVVQWSQM